jgi:anaerobic magnesium-protoporphyrin IX monomethyl ester cyclase
LSSRLTVLINPPPPSGQTANRDGAGGLGALLSGEGQFHYPPLALAYAAADVRQAGWTVRVIDAVGERLGLGKTVDRIPAEASVAVVLASWATAGPDGEFLRALRTTRPDIRILLLAASLDCWATEKLTGLVDAFLLGDGELYAARAVEAVKDGATGALDPTGLGLAGYAPGARRATLAGLPHPAWDLLPWRAYPFLTALASRGCPDACVYCPYVVGQGTVFRARPAEEVVDELCFVARTFQPRRMILRDPVFAREPERTARIAEGLARAGVRLNWECESRPEHFADPSLLRLLRRARCSSIKVGLESGDAALLVALERVRPEEAEGYLETARRLVQSCRQAGLPCRPFVMVGLPGQASSSVQQTARFVRDVQPSYLHVKSLVAYPGTRLAWPTTPQVVDSRAVAEQEAALKAIPLAPSVQPAWWRPVVARLRQNFRTPIASEGQATPFGRRKGE